MSVGLASVLVFSIVLLVYLHMVHQRRVHNDNEVNILEINNPETLTDVSELRVPFVFRRDVQVIRSSGLTYNGLLEIEDNSSVRVLDISGDVVTSSSKPWNVFSDALRNGGQKASCENVEWPLKLGRIQPLVERYNDFWKPYMNVCSTNTIAIGSSGTKTQFRQSSQGRQYITCLDGRVNVSLLMSNVSGGDISTDGEDRVLKNYDTDKETNVLTVTLEVGEVLCVPPYWWYSLVFGECALTMVSKYRSLANYLGNIDTIGMAILRRFNTHKRIMGPSALNDKSHLVAESVLSSVEHIE